MSGRREEDTDCHDTLTHLASLVSRQHYCSKVNLLQRLKISHCLDGVGQGLGSFIADGVEGEAVSGRGEEDTDCHETLTYLASLVSRQHYCSYSLAVNYNK